MKKNEHCSNHIIACGRDSSDYLDYDNLCRGYQTYQPKEMKEVKFRAWNGTRMYIWEEIRRYRNLCKLISLYHIHVMQWIGLKDKNGKDIYMGDVVVGETFEGVPIKGIVDFDSGSFYITDRCTSFYRWVDYEVEVIGNIYENPELEREVFEY